MNVHDLRVSDPRSWELLDALEREQESLDLEDRLREKAPAKEESDGGIERERGDVQRHVCGDGDA